jgi:DME family drug/metabolite transporter
MNDLSPAASRLEKRTGDRAKNDGWLALLTAATLWGTTGIVFHALGASGGANAVSISFLRLALSVPFFLVIARIHGGRWLVPLTLRGLLTLTALGLCMAFYQLTYVLAIERVGVAISVLISICGAPIIVACLSVLWLRESIRARTIVALAAAIVGTVLLVGRTPQAGVLSGPFASGIAFAVACAACYAFYLLAARAAGRACGPMHAGAISFALGALALLPFAGHDGLQLRYSPSGWAMLLYVAAVPTALAQTLFLGGIKTTGAIGGAIASLVEPLVSTVLAVLLLHERMTWYSGLGAVILLAAIALMQSAPAGNATASPANT